MFDLKNIKDAVTSAIPFGDNVDLGSLLNDEFISKHTKFKSLDELTESLGISKDLIGKVSESDLDGMISKVSDFTSWKDFIALATKEKLLNK